MIEVCTDPHCIAHGGLVDLMTSVRKFIAFLEFQFEFQFEVKLDKPIIEDGIEYTGLCIELVESNIYIYMRNECSKDVQDGG